MFAVSDDFMDDRGLLNAFSKKSKFDWVLKYKKRNDYALCNIILNTEN